LEALLEEILVARWRAGITEAEYQRVLEELVARRISPAQAVAALVDGSISS
jgi:hypothetical protein